MTFKSNFIFGAVQLTNGDDTLSAKKYLLADVFGRDGDDAFIATGNGSISFSAFKGGAGNDRLVVDADTSLIGSSTYNGGADKDILEFSSSDRIVMRETGVSSTGETEITLTTLKFGWLPLGSITTTSVERFVITGSAYNDVLVGSSSNDWLDGGAGADTFAGSAGDDGYVFSSAAERVVGETQNGGEDSIWTTVSVDLRQNQFVENLRLYEEGGAINAIGNELANLITGNAAKNVITGGLGNDSLYGKGGADVFVFAEYGQANKDSVWDFDSDDKIQLSKSVFSGLDANNDGVLNAGALTFGTRAEGTNAQIIYDAKTGNISYDADGTGSSPTEVIALIGRNLPFLDHKDFLLA
ncbi:calcium-binding protein [Aureimonas phyllosphaerae]|uniref:Ca2+-binding RTX toxin-like protein n=1 Tax=Aureimonas phyllosphaerae TaxID=1166078 RepID=A0A7W6C206_9HYPH|nr:calcium-binding protein [Aureimonas phyllosphaerae]MBB3938036.1 Ca2+-binding RTX toxin-like protein [Aureimonas phyllosphaerae]MBB3962043.1 Ca2+-binding RTX toxin-like protein [Aureimonas phyllosphaerae]SFF54173.1 hypothetical protein SAMN05216566_12443 [Aureimonas phyllosphaerae]